MTSSQSRPAAPQTPRRENRAWTSIREARDDLLPDDLDGAHDLVVRRVADLEHEDHLIDAGGRPALHLAAHAVGVAPDGHPLVEEVVIRIPRHAGLDPSHALGRPE